MLGAYVCRQCRTRLSQRIVPVRTPQWHRRAASNFTSLRPRDRQDNTPPPPQDEEQTSSQSQRYTSQESHLGGPRIRYEGVGSQTPPTSGRYSRLVRDEGGDTHDRLDAGDLTSRSEALSDGQRGHAQAIQELLDSRKVRSAWQLFEETYTSRDCKALTDPPASDVELLKTGKIFEKLLNSVHGSFCRGSNIHITPTAALFKYEQLGISNRKYWYHLTLPRLTTHVIHAINATSAQPQLYLPSLLHELLSLWRLFFQCKGPRDDPLEFVSEEWQLPATESLPNMFSEKDFLRRLQNYCPRFVANPTLGYCAIYFYNISNALDEEARQQAAPFLHFLERLLAGSSVTSVFKYTGSAGDFKTLPKDIQVQVLREINEAPRKAWAAIVASGVTLGAEATDSAATDLEKFYLKRIARVIDTKASPAILDKMWTEIEGQYSSQDRTNTIPLRLYNEFLSGYMIISSPKRSVEIWNHMIAHGVKPDMGSWVALLEGCAKGRDLNGLNAMWARMMSTGIEPDNHAWTTRVNGLMSLGSINQALAALDEMAKRWLSAETVLNNPQTHGKGHKGPKKLPSSSKAVNRCTKPSIEVINGAISALLRKKIVKMDHKKREEYVQRLLIWSANFQIQPDAYTYNNLIRLYMQEGDTATATKLLTQMESAGIKADITTLNMFLAASFDNPDFADLTPDQQTERLLSTFNKLEANGMKMNDTVYATVIDRLLKKKSNHTTILAVMSHMTERNFVPSAHTYTSFITHHFQADPPNIRAVDGLVHHLFTSHGTHTDKVLYDRLIEGYSRFDEVGSMMMVLVRMSKQGLQPGWNALTAAINALVRAGDYERARMIVRDVERGEGVAQGGVVGLNHGQYIFWAAVRELGVGTEEGTMGEYMGRSSGGLAEATSDWESRQDSVTEQHMQYEQEDPGSVDYQQQQQGTIQYQYEAISQDQPTIQYSRDPGAVAPEDEEDVHGFLTDDPEVEQKRQQKP